MSVRVITGCWTNVNVSTCSLTRELKAVVAELKIKAKQASRNVTSLCWQHVGPLYKTTEDDDKPIDDMRLFTVLGGDATRIKAGVLHHRDYLQRLKIPHWTEKLNRFVLIHDNFLVAVDEHKWLCNEKLSWINTTRFSFSGDHAHAFIMN